MSWIRKSWDWPSSENKHKLVSKVAKAVSRRIGPTSHPDVTALHDFVWAMSKVSSPCVLEIGTRVQLGQSKTRKTDWIPHASSFVGVDYIEGEDVDVVVDVHRLSTAFAKEEFDAVLSCSVFEHIKYPWLATLEMAKVVKIGGYVFLHTVQTFAEHGAPFDYWRFNIEGLKALFPPAMGIQILHCHYQCPCWIISGDDPNQSASPTYLNVLLLGRKVSHTPENYPVDLP